ncbi:MAG TPA: ABC transporter ATP-binding protein [Pyrinomonadaceae bacterium]
MKPIIKAENLSKRYRLGRQKQHNSLRDSLVDVFRAPLRSLKRNADKKDAEFWALKDVNFEVFPGEVVGIIGRNGAGKSTLLKILSRITKPTAGTIELHGRIASLLEVGTGFHSELTGRENIFLNGAILGMRREEIARKFDEIVAFAEVEKFLDTPVKHYSSGMYVRLAFAVAAHLEPEILVIDEVLAVGDAEFQKKCLGKMDEVSKGGRTILFVSHQMGTVAQLCQKAILLDQGSIVMNDETSVVIEHYVNRNKSKDAFYVANEAGKQSEMYVQSAFVANKDGIEQTSFRHDESVGVNVKCAARKWVRGAELRMVVKDNRSITVFTADAELDSLNETTRSFEVDFVIPAEFLRPNHYSLTFALFVPHQVVIELIDDVIFFSVFDFGTKYAQSEGLDYGLVFSPCEIFVQRIA